MHRVVSGALAVLLVVLAMASAPALAAGRLVIEEKAWNAGEVELGAVLEHDFLFTNVGDEPVKIKDVLPQCGCTVPEYPKVVAPGETAAVKLRIDTKTLHSGKNSKTTTVLTNAPGSERVILQVKMQLFTPLEFLPRPMVYLRSVKGQSKEEKVLARPHRKGMKITGVESNNPNISVRFEPAEVAAESDDGTGRLANVLLPREGDVWITVTLGPETPEGIHRAEIIVRTTDPEYPEAQIRVSAAVKSP
ncbi:MAG: DUF1573 domain-containing protein [Acidobacteriota bacterium]|nr:DUF1573 domain-containing protein [Acidobacteriota bacterium]